MFHSLARYNVRHDHHVAFALEIPDEWLATAGMVGFTPTPSAYRDGPSCNPDLQGITLPLTSIWVPERGIGVPNFGRERMICVLEAIRLDRSLPPLQVEAEPRDHFSHRLYHGRHRFAASLALRFEEIVTEVVGD